MVKKIFWAFIMIVFITVTVNAEKGSLNISVYPKPPNLTTSVKFIEPSGENVLNADETGTLIIKISNNGKGIARDVKADITSEKSVKHLKYEQITLFGKITPGESITKEVQIRAEEDIATSDISLHIEIKEANGFDGDPIRIAFKSKAFEPPKLIVADIGISDPDGNPKITPQQVIELTARIQNLGYGDAKNVKVNVHLGPNVFMAAEGGTAHFDLGTMHAGTHQDIKIMFFTNKLIKNGEKIPITLSINEARPKFRVEQPLKLVMNAPQKSIREFIVKSDEGKRGAIQLATGLSVDVDMNIPDGEKAGPDDIAVIIGNKNYTERGVPEVTYADRDARIMKEYLIKTFRFKPENLIYEEDATFAKFRQIFGDEHNYQGKLDGYVKKNISSVFIYYVGHGAPDLKSTEAYFVPVDANPQYIVSNGYRLETFYTNLSKIKAKKITVVLDACFSGNSEKGLLFKDISPTMVKVKRGYRAPRNAMLMTSAAEDQVSTWFPEKKHSLFTYFFLKGIQGEADANNDNSITAAEIKAYLKDKVPYMARRLNNIDQQPVITGGDNEIFVILKK